MICPKCNAEYIEGYTKCSDCGEDLVAITIDRPKDFKFDLFKLGRMPAKMALSLLFYLSIIPTLYISILFGKYIYLANTYMKTIKTGDVFTSIEVNNSTLGVFAGVVLFIVSTLIIKIVFELLLIMFTAIEAYIKKAKS